MGKRSLKRTRPEKAPEHAGSIRKSGFIMVRPLEGGNTPVIIESWDDYLVGRGALDAFLPLPVVAAPLISPSLHCLMV